MVSGLLNNLILTADQFAPLLTELHWNTTNGGRLVPRQKSWPHELFPAGRLELSNLKKTSLQNSDDCKILKLKNVLLNVLSTLK